METSKENSVRIQTSLLNGVEKSTVFSRSKATGMDNIKHSDILRFVESVPILTGNFLSQ